MAKVQHHRMKLECSDQDSQNHEIVLHGCRSNSRERQPPCDHAGGKSPMKPVLRKCGKLLLWVLPVVLALYIVVMGLDFLGYRSQVPMRFRDANWEGHWATHRFWPLAGRLLVRLPDPIPDGIDFKAEAMVY
jgi:hypothetical protein